MIEIDQLLQWLDKQYKKAMCENAPEAALAFLLVTNHIKISDRGIKRLIEK